MAFTKKVLKSGRTIFLGKTKVVGIQFSPRGMATVPWAVDILKRPTGRLLTLRHFRTKKQAMDFVKTIITPKKRRKQ